MEIGRARRRARATSR